MNHTYNRLIDIALAGNIPHERISNALMKAYPDIFLELYERKEPQAWFLDIAKFYKNDEKISAIKRIREMTGFGLLEAKQTYEQMAFYRGHIGYIKIYGLDRSIDDLAKALAQV
jgi:hypothetical protein